MKKGRLKIENFDSYYTKVSNKKTRIKGLSK